MPTGHKLLNMFIKQNQDCKYDHGEDIIDVFKTLNPSIAIDAWNLNEINYFGNNYLAFLETLICCYITL